MQKRLEASALKRLKQVKKCFFVAIANRNFLFANHNCFISNTINTVSAASIAIALTLLMDVNKVYN